VSELVLDVQWSKAMTCPGFQVDLPQLLKSTEVASRACSCHLTTSMRLRMSEAKTPSCVTKDLLSFTHTSPIRPITPFAMHHDSPTHQSLLVAGIAAYIWNGIHMQYQDWPPVSSPPYDRDHPSPNWTTAHLKDKTLLFKSLPDS
jgi:hypothetical protein